MAEFLYSLPPEFKIQKNLGKYIHRQAMEGIVPQKVISRKDKVGYLAPGEHYWMKKEFSSFVEPMFNSPDFKNRDIYNHNLIQTIYIEMIHGKKGDEKSIWNLMSLEVWFKSQGL